MKLLLLADQRVGIDIFRFLLKDFRIDLSAVVTIEKNLIYNEAEASNIPVYLFNQELEEKISSKEFDLGVMAWWPYVLKEPLLSKPNNGFINTHPSFLPHNKGKHYNFWAIIEEAPFGVTLHKVDKGIDTGDIIAQSKINYDWTDNGKTLYEKAQVEIVRLFIKWYPIIRTGSYELKTQNSSDGSFHYASELNLASQINLNATYSARNLLNLIRARTFEGHPGCWFEDNGKYYEISILIKELKK